jgi:hypothetical protein
MVYWDGQRYVSRAPTLIPDIRAHVANWSQFKKVAKSWPLLSIATFITRFIIMIGGVVAGLAYSVRHDLTKGQGFLVCLAALLPVLFVWLVVERVAWNHDLRQKGISSERDVWSVTQFPQE